MKPVRYPSLYCSFPEDDGHDRKLRRGSSDQRPMSNEEVLREAVAAFNDEDRTAIDRLLAPEVEVVNALSDIRSGVRQPA